MSREIESNLKDDEDPKPSWQGGILTIVSVLIGFGPILWVYFENLWCKPGFFIFPLAFVVAVYCLQRVFREFNGLAHLRSPMAGGWLLPLVAGGLLIIASIEWRSGLVFAALMLSLWVFFWNRGGWSLAFDALPAICLMGLCSAPAVLWIEKWSSFLRNLSNHVGSFLLGLFAVPNSIVDGTLKLTAGRMVPVSCEQWVNGLFLSCVLAFSFCLLKRRPLFFLPFLVISTTLSLFVADCFAIVAIGLDLLTLKTPEGLYGWIVGRSLFVAFTGVFLADALLAQRFLWPVEKNQNSNLPESIEHRLPWGFRSRLVPLVLLIAGAIQGFHVWKTNFHAPPKKEALTPIPTGEFKSH